MKKFLWPTIIIAAVIGAWFWFSRGSENLHFDTIADQGADHVNDIAGVNYNSNPPTSGPHFPVWAKRGAYTQVLSDGYLIHSLEHGYVVISYNCDRLSAGRFIPAVFAHEGEDIATSSASPDLYHLTFPPPAGMSWLTPENPPDKVVDLPERFASAPCQALVDQLTPLLNSYQRLIIVPRPELDVAIALTAWGKIDKMDSFDEARIKAFASSFHNAGPEKTTE